MSSQIEIVIADAQPIFRIGLRKILEEADRFKVTGEAADGEAALVLITDLKPNVSILAADLPKKDVLEVARALLSYSSAVEIILLINHESELRLNMAFDLGVKGYLMEDSSPGYLIDAVNAVCVGRSFMSPALSASLINSNREM